MSELDELLSGYEDDIKEILTEFALDILDRYKNSKQFEEDAIEYAHEMGWTELA